MEEKKGIKLGRLSGIVAHYVPKYLQKNRLPSWKTNCIDDWETKVDAIVEETFHQNMTVISGIPSWVQMYFEKLKTKSKLPVGELFINFNLFILEMRWYIIRFLIKLTIIVITHSWMNFRRLQYLWRTRCLSVIIFINRFKTINYHYWMYKIRFFITLFHLLIRNFKNNFKNIIIKIYLFSILLF